MRIASGWVGWLGGFAQPRNQQLEDGERNHVGSGGHGEDKELMEREIPLDDPGEGSPAKRSGGSADPDNGGDGGGGEHVGGSGEEVRAPALVSGSGNCDQQRGGPRVAGEELAHV